MLLLLDSLLQESLGWGRHSRSPSQQKRALLFKIRSTRWGLHVCKDGESVWRMPMFTFFQWARRTQVPRILGSLMAMEGLKSLLTAPTIFADTLGAHHNKREHCSSKFGVQGGVFMYARMESQYGGCPCSHSFNGPGGPKCRVFWGL